MVRSLHIVSIQIENISSILVNNSDMYGITQSNTRSRPARLTIKACSSLPDCFSIWLRIVTRIPTSAILNRIDISICFVRFPSFYSCDGHRSASWSQHKTDQHPSKGSQQWIQSGTVSAIAIRLVNTRL